MDKKSWNVVYFNRPDVHKNLVWSDGKRYFDGFLGLDNSVYRKTSGTPVEEPNAVYWTEKPFNASDDQE
jgi:hypothetical protein|tara:strand:- start:89 stop:295 length:207 start_codon:yes stop_codon:yes gene_type:complete